MSRTETDRNAFAAAALTGLLAHPSCNPWIAPGEGDGYKADLASAVAFEYADAMIAVDTMAERRIAEAARDRPIWNLHRPNGSRVESGCEVEFLESQVDVNGLIYDIDDLIPSPGGRITHAVHGWYLLPIVPPAERSTDA